jgi:hypothetical protein
MGGSPTPKLLLFGNGSPPTGKILDELAAAGPHVR